MSEMLSKTLKYFDDAEMNLTVQQTSRVCEQWEMPVSYVNGTGTGTDGKLHTTHDVPEKSEQNKQHKGRLSSNKSVKYNANVRQRIESVIAKYHVIENVSVINGVMMINKLDVINDVTWALYHGGQN